MAAPREPFTRVAERIGLGRSPIWDGCGDRCGRRRDGGARCPDGFRPCGDACRPLAACCPGETVDLLVVPTGGTHVASRAVLAAGVPYEVEAAGLVPAGNDPTRRCDAVSCFDPATGGRPTDRCDDGTPLGLRLAGVSPIGAGWEGAAGGHEYRAVVVGIGAPLRLVYRRCGGGDGTGFLAVSIRCADPNRLAAQAAAG